MVLELTGAVRAARARLGGGCHGGRALDGRRGRVRVLFHLCLEVVGRQLLRNVAGDGVGLLWELELHGLVP